MGTCQCTPIAAMTAEMTCPICGAPEVMADTPRTVYACGSSDYDQRPGTFVGHGVSSERHAGNDGADCGVPCA